GGAPRLLGRGDRGGGGGVVAAGPTQEPVDDVRFLGNRSSGKMGAALAAAAAARGGEVTLGAGARTPAGAGRRAEWTRGAGPGPPAVAVPGVRRVDIGTAAELELALVELAPLADV